MPTVGLLYPGYSAEDDYPRFVARLREAGVRPPDLPLVHTRMDEDAHRVDALLEIGRADHLAAGGRELVAEHGAESVMWACTSGSFVFGWEGAREQAEQLAEAVGRAAAEKALKVVDTKRHHRFAASYPQDIAEAFVAFLGAAGIEVVAMGSHGIVTAAEVGTLGREQVLAVVRGADLSERVQAVLVPDTAMHTLEWLSDAEAETGRPVLTANQVTIWKGLQLLGVRPSLPGSGRLFAQER